MTHPIPNEPPIEGQPPGKSFSEKYGRITLDCVLLILSTVLCLGSAYIFHTCAAKEDGSYMTCHWANVAVSATSALLIFDSILLFLFRDSKAQAAICFSMLPITVLIALYPNTLIPMCMMASMRCLSVFRPAVWIFDGLIAITALINCLVYTFRKPNHNRPMDGRRERV